MADNYYVYLYYEPGCAEPFYVGKGSGRRAWMHLEAGQLQRTSTLFSSKIKSLLRSGVTPEIELADENLTESQAFQLEKDLIRKLGRKDQGLGPLLNLTDGGEGTSGQIDSPETTLRRSESHKGLKASLETRKKVSDSKLGLIAYNRKPIIAKWENGTIYKEYDCIDHVREDGFDPSNISKVLVGKQMRGYGLLWETK